MSSWSKLWKKKTKNKPQPPAYLKMPYWVIVLLNSFYSIIFKHLFTTLSFSAIPTADQILLLFSQESPPQVAWGPPNISENNPFI